MTATMISGVTLDGVVQAPARTRTPGEQMRHRTVPQHVQVIDAVRAAVRSCSCFSARSFSAARQKGGSGRAAAEPGVLVSRWWSWPLARWSCQVTAISAASKLTSSQVSPRASPRLSPRTKIKT